MQGTEPQIKQYIYCVIRCSEPREFETPGLGAPGSVVHTVHADGLAAVVSASPKEACEQTRRNMIAHTRVLEEVMQEHAILPMRFGTIAPSEEAVCGTVLRPQHQQLIRELDWIDGRVELGLKVFWPEEEAIFKEILEEEPSVRRLRDRLMGRRPEVTYYDRIELGKMIEAALEKKRAADREHILQPLCPLVDEFKQRDTVMDMMVLNVALLVKKSLEPEIDRAIESLDRSYGSRLRFKYVGPVPPYNFINLNIN